MNQSVSAIDRSELWPTTVAGRIRHCTPTDFDVILDIIGEASEVYRDAIPDDCWHDPYMSRDALSEEVRRGVSFVGYEIGGELVGVMGWERVLNALLIRHAYVRRSDQGRGIGALLLHHLRATDRDQWLVGTWADASWAIRFYEKNGFKLLEPSVMALFLRTYWAITPRQVEVSVVLACPHLSEAEAMALADNSRSD